MNADLARQTLVVSIALLLLACGATAVQSGLSQEDGPGAPGSGGAGGSGGTDGLGGSGGTGGDGGTGGLGGTGGFEGPDVQRRFLAVALDLNPVAPLLFEAKYRVIGRRLVGVLVPLVADATVLSSCGSARRPAPAHPADPDGLAEIPFEGTLFDPGFLIVIGDVYLGACANAFSANDLYLDTVRLEGSSDTLCGTAELNLEEPYTATLGARFGSRPLAEGQSPADLGAVTGCP